MRSLFKIFNIIVLIIIVLGALSWGIWGFFHVEVLAVFFGPESARVLYCIIGLCGMYGVHLFVDYSRKTWRF